VDLPRLQI